MPSVTITVLSSVINIASELYFFNIGRDLLTPNIKRAVDNPSERAPSDQCVHSPLISARQ